MTYRRAKLMWQVSHLNGLTLVSDIQIRTESGPERHASTREKESLTSKNMPFQMFVSGEGLPTVCAKNHDGRAGVKRCGEGRRRLKLY